ncbi:MAG: transglutaminase family protein [Chitinophagales bacterium]|nr:transglutaminase-like domain-containing protein [Chitinophagales bacterium]MDW8393658.1 transglutaminase family protein [Chitinophagales bacterium]
MKRKAGAELNALLQLLDDPDEEVYQQVHDRLIAYGPAIIPTLEKAWENSTAEYSAQRIVTLIQRLHRNRIVSDLKKWGSTANGDLLEAALILSRYRFMNQNERRLKTKIGELADQVSMEFSYHMPPLEQISIYNHVLFDLNQFRTVPLRPENEQYGYLKEALESRKATPMLMGLLYLIIARMLQLPVHGVLLPHHLVISFHKSFVRPEDSLPRLSSSLLFYINPAHKGNVFSKDAISIMLRKLELDPKPSHFLPASSCQIIQALLDQMILGAERWDQEERLDDLKRMRAALAADHQLEWDD